jgi:hypothetical protein
MSPFFQKTMIFVALTAFVVLSAYTFNKPDQGDQTKLSIKEKLVKESKFISIDNELETSSANVIGTEKLFRKIAVKNKAKLTTANCRGVLMDSNNDGMYDNKVFGVTISNDSNIVIHYNMCGFVDNNKILVMTTTKRLIDKKEINNDGNYYIPVVIYTTFDKPGVEPLEQKGLMNFDEFMSF